MHGHVEALLLFSLAALFASIVKGQGALNNTWAFDGAPTTPRTTVLDLGLLLGTSAMPVQYPSSTAATLQLSLGVHHPFKTHGELHTLMGCEGSQLRAAA